MPTIYSSYAPKAKWTDSKLEFSPIFRVELFVNSIGGWNMLMLDCRCVNQSSLLEGYDTLECFRDIHAASHAYSDRVLSESPWNRTEYGFDPPECKGTLASIRLDHATKMVEEIERRYLFDDVGSGYHQLKSQIERVSKGK